MEPAPNGVAGAAIALVALFLPGFLILIGALPFWDRLRRTPWARSSMQGANAAVVGMPDFALAVVCFMALMAWKAPPWIVVRSEEHTSELQSLMRISYAVF